MTTSLKIKKAFLSVLTALLISSCAVTRKNKETKTATTSVSEQVRDSISSETINRAINDTIRISVPYTDPETDEKLNNILRQISTSKSSGSSGYQLYYNEQLRQLEARLQIAESKDTQITEKSEKTTEKTFEEQVDEYVKKIVIPWWMYAIAFFLLLPQIKMVLGMVFPIIKPFLNKLSDDKPGSNKVSE